jgi:hypothetical protein
MKLLGAYELQGLIAAWAGNWIHDVKNTVKAIE